MATNPIGIDEGQACKGQRNEPRTGGERPAPPQGSAPIDLETAAAELEASSRIAMDELRARWQVQPQDCMRGETYWVRHNGQWWNVESDGVEKFGCVHYGETEIVHHSFKMAECEIILAAPGTTARRRQLPAELRAGLEQPIADNEKPRKRG